MKTLTALLLMLVGILGSGCAHAPDAETAAEPQPSYAAAPLGSRIKTKSSASQAELPREQLEQMRAQQGAIETRNFQRERTR